MSERIYLVRERAVIEQEYRVRATSKTDAIRRVHADDREHIIDSWVSTPQPLSQIRIRDVDVEADRG